MNRNMSMGLLFLAGLAGLIGGAWMGSKPPTNPERARSGTPRNVSSGRSSRLTRAEPKRDFASLLEQLKQTDGIPTAGFETMERSSNAQLRDLLVSLSNGMSDRRDVLANRACYKAMRSAARELFLREGRGSIEWAEASGAENVFLVLLCEAARLDSALAKEWSPRFFDKYGKPSNSIINAAYCSAAMRSADDLLAAEKLFGCDTGSPLEGFSEGFDFRAYLAGTSSDSGLHEGFRFWSALDPEAAEKALREGIGKTSGHWDGVYSAAFQARAELVGDAEAARWIGGVIADAHEFDRRDALRRFASDDRLSSSRIIALVDNLPTDRDRVGLVTNVVERWAGLVDADEPQQALMALKSETLQAEVLSTWLKKSHETNRGNMREPLERMMESLALAPSRRDELRALIPAVEKPD